MQTNSWGVVYFLLLLADICFVALDIPEARYVTKPSLMIVLGCYCWSRAGDIQERRRNLIFAAIIFAWWGDIFLLFEEFFLPGLISFLTAHLFYLTFFLLVRPKTKLDWKDLLFSAFVVVYAATLVWLNNIGLAGTPELKTPVFVYAAVITLMLLSAVIAFGVNGTPAGMLCVSGAALFVVSDSLLALNMFYTPFMGAGILIMLTYGCAQWLIVEGSTRYLKTVNLAGGGNA